MSSAFFNSLLHLQITTTKNNLTSGYSRKLSFCFLQFRKYRPTRRNVNAAQVRLTARAVHGANLVHIGGVLASRASCVFTIARWLVVIPKGALAVVQAISLAWICLAPRARVSALAAALRRTVRRECALALKTVVVAVGDLAQGASESTNNNNNEDKLSNDKLYFANYKSHTYPGLQTQRLSTLLNFPPLRQFSVFSLCKSFSSVLVVKLL